MGRVAVVLLCSAVILISGFVQFGLCLEDDDHIIRMKLGGFRDRGNLRNSVEIETVARFAVQEHNRRENAFLEFSRVLKAREQLVAGKLYHITLEVIEAGKKKIYEAKVWVKPWMNFKQLEEFKRAEHVTSFAPSELGVKPDGNEYRWRAVPTNDPEVQDAANHAVKSMQQKSNSLYPYTLLDVLAARAKVLEDSAKIELLLKVCRGNKREFTRIQVTKKCDGKFCRTPVV